MNEAVPGFKKINRCEKTGKKKKKKNQFTEYKKSATNGEASKR